MENLVSLKHFKTYFEGKTILLTGHTGFKGSWLLQILARCGADITGFALEAEHPSLYNQINGDALCNSIIHDLRDAGKVIQTIELLQPDFIFHLAAQPLVLDSYQRPLYTFEVNTLGTAHVLEGLRKVEKPCVAVMITTDKVYENKEQGNLFKEEDKLGGYDPYSASKAACEIVISSYVHSYFNPNQQHQHQKKIVSVRAGNVIGGGDYAANRIIPDIIKAIQKEEAVTLRNPQAVRPWQHVLEPLGAYLLLATALADGNKKLEAAYNIGPEKTDILSVEVLTQTAIEVMKKGHYHIEQQANAPHEAGLLMLSIDTIKRDLSWQPKWDAKTAIQQTVEWYLSEESADIKCLQQIQTYFEDNIENSEES